MIRHHRLALLFAFLSCVIPPLSEMVAKAFPDQRVYFRLEKLINEGELFITDYEATQSGMYKEYTVHERVRAWISVLGFAFCLAAFFIGKAAVGGPEGRKRDICLIAAAMGICSSASYGGGGLFLILFLVFMLRLLRKDEIPIEPPTPQTTDNT